MAQAVSAFEKFMRSMSLRQFVEYFGYYGHPNTGDTTKFIPWPKQLEFLDWIDGLTDIGFLLKSRQAGGSTIASMLVLKTIFDHSNIQVIVLSKDEDAATYFLVKRLMDAYNALPSIQGIVWPKVTKFTQQHIVFSNGSKVSSSPATAIGAAGVTAKLVIFDEVSLVDLNAAARGGAAEVFATVRPVIQKAGGRMLLLSTARSGSFFNTMVEGILDGTKTGIPLFFFAASDDPTLTPEVIEKLRQEYPNDVDFRREFPMKPEDAFLTRNGLVFRGFSPDKHIHEVEIDPTWDTLAVFDHGYAHPSVLLICKYDYIADIAYVINEHRWVQTDVPTIAKELRLIKMGLPIDTTWIADAAIFNRTGHGDTIADLYLKVGIPFQPSYKYKGNDPLDGSIAKMALRFAQNKLIIFPQANGLIKEIKNWKWKLNSVRDMPEDVNDDAIDCCKYLIAHIHIRNKQKEQEKVEAYSHRKSMMYHRLGALRNPAVTSAPSWQEC